MAINPDFGETFSCLASRGDTRLVSVLSGGAFNVTVGPVVILWGFGTGGVDAELPSQQQIDTTMERVGYRRAVDEALAVKLVIRSADGFRIPATPQFEHYAPH